MSSKRIVVVLGMHRSGTSAVARGLQALGVSLGDRLMPPVPNNNEKGFFEDIDANALNKELMVVLGRDWDTLAPVRVADLQRHDVKPFRKRAVELLRSRLEGVSSFGMKDPRVSVLLPFWKDVFHELGLEASYAICARHPLSVARSLEKRDGIEIEKSCYLWLDHVACAILATRDSPRVVVGYDRLMQKPQEQLRRMARALGLTFDPESPAVAEYAREFISEDLRHNRFDLDDLKNAEGLPADVVEAQALLDKLSRDELGLDAASVTSFFEGLANRLEEVRPALAYISRRDAEVARLIEEGRVRGREMAALQQTSQANAERIAEAEKALAAGAIRIGELELQVAQIAQLQEALDRTQGELELNRRRLAETLRDITRAHDRATALAEQITTLETDASRRDAEVAQINAQIAQLQHEVQRRDRILALMEHRFATWLGGIAGRVSGSVRSLFGKAGA